MKIKINMRNYSHLIPLIFTLLLLSCTAMVEKKTVISIKNSLELDREFETVEITRASIGLANETSLEEVFLQDVETKTFLTTQTVDQDGDGTSDILLFQPKIKAFAEKQFEIVLNATIARDTSKNCYSRFVPERTDDYAWENNRVAFRTFGPTAQKMIEENVPEGTLSSGMDAWLKKVEYPIINKWYKETISGKGSYHQDTGEGLDNFHVGASRGVGGTAIKIDSMYYFSKNFTAWKTICNGPIRTSFTLTYEDWDANGNKIIEKKNISLDYGNNLSKFEIKLMGTQTISTGLTLHEQDGEIEVNLKEGWLSYWEPHEDSELGTGIVAPKNIMIDYEKYITSKKDESNLYAQLNVANSKVIYYAGFGWKKSGQFQTKKDWENYLSDFSNRINSPLIVVIK